MPGFAVSHRFHGPHFVASLLLTTPSQTLALRRSVEPEVGARQRSRAVRSMLILAKRDCEYAFDKISLKKSIRRTVLGPVFCRHALAIRLSSDKARERLWGGRLPIAAC